MKGCRCPDCHDARLQATNIQRHGVPYISQRQDFKEKMVVGLIKYIDDKRYKIDEVIKTVEDAGCKLLSTEYKN